MACLLTSQIYNVARKIFRSHLTADLNLITNILEGIILVDKFRGR